MKRKNIQFFLLIAISFSLLVPSAFSASNPYIASHGINFAIGNKYHRETDTTIDGPVSSLSFTRHYNSQSTVDTDLGYGWSHSYADIISVTSDVIRYTRPDGRVVDYLYDNGSASWVKEAGKVEKFTQETDGYYLNEANGATKKFDLTTGKLLELTDRHGNTTTLTYSTGQTNIEDNFGRQLTLIFDVNGKLETLSTPLGNFTYSYSSGNLDKVYRPDSTAIYKQYLYTGTYLTGMTNEVGDTLFSVAYTDDLVTSSSLQGGMHPITIDYQAENLVVVTDETNQVTTTYNLTFKHGIAQVESFSGPGCSSCGSDNGTLTYTDLLQVESSTDANNIKTSYGYDANGNRETITEADGNPLQRVTTTIHDLSTNLVTSITKGSVGSCGQQAVETWVYDINNHPDYKTESGCNGTSAITRNTEYTYDPFGRIEYFNGPRSDGEFTVGKDDISFTYYPDDTNQGNKQGMLHTVTNGLGHVTEFKEYNGLRKPTLIEDPNDVQTTLSYNDFGQLTIRTIGTRTITYEYDNAGVLQNIFLPGSRSLHYDYLYQVNGKEEKITDNEGNYLTFFYDSLGNPAGRDINASDDTLAATISYVHDIKGRLSKTYDGIDSDLIKPSEELIYDSAGNLEERKILKDYASDTYLSTIYTYDALNRLWKIQDPGSATDNTIFGYDIHDNQTSVTDDNGVITSYIFDDFGRKVSEKITENGVETLIANFEYDLADNLIQKIDGNSKTIDYQYDALNRRTDVAYTDSTQDIKYIYDEDVDTLPNKGRLTSMDDSSGNSGYAYNIYSDLTKETRITDGYPFVTEYNYNDNSELYYIIYPSGRKITYNRTTIGQLSSIGSLYQGIFGVVASDIRSKPFGPITKMTMGNGQQLTNTHDTLYRLNSAAVDSIYDRSYTYWSNGQVKVITDGVNSSSNQTFNYDDLGHLATAAGSYGNLGFDHDNVDNRTSLTDSGGTTTYDYFIGSNRLNQVSNGSTVNYGYDNIGNIISSSQDNTVFDWSDDYRLQSVTKNAATVGSYKYDGRGLRTAKTTGSETTLFVYDKAGNLFVEADNQGNVLKEYVYVNGQVFAHFQYDPLAQPASSGEGPEVPEEDDVPVIVHEGEITEPSGDVIAAATSSEIASMLIPIYFLLLFNDDPAAEGAYYYITDHLGTPQIITDDAGAIVWKGIYSPFGTVTVDVSSSITNNLRFPGQYYDQETGLHYNWNRYYDPDTGRYISADPIGLRGGMNLYSYANQNPINFIDPLGLATYRTVEGHYVLGGGFLEIDCCTEDNRALKHLYVKVCLGAAVEASGGAGWASNSDGKSCSSPPRHMLGGELSASYIAGVEVAATVDSADGGGLSLSGGGGAGVDWDGGKVGFGAKATACYYYLLNTIPSNTECDRCEDR